MSLLYTDMSADLLPAGHALALLSASLHSMLVDAAESRSQPDAVLVAAHC